jgi:hypothetical protein
VTKAQNYQLSNEVEIFNRDSHELDYFFNLIHAYISDEPRFSSTNKPTQKLNIDQKTNEMCVNIKYREESYLSKNFSISGISSLMYHLHADPPLKVFSVVLVEEK